jgi:hypothetical protein
VVDEAVAQKERDEKKAKEDKPVADKSAGGGAT